MTYLRSGYMNYAMPQNRHGEKILVMSPIKDTPFPQPEIVM